MMRGKYAAAAAGLIAAAALAGPALAQDRGLYVGGTAGDSEFRHTCSLYDVSCEHDGTAFRAFGGYQYNPHFAVEAGYASLRDIQVEGIFEGEARIGDVSAIASWPFNERLAILGRLGIYRSQVEVHFAGGGSVSEHNSGWTYGFGANVVLTRNLVVRAEYQHYKDIGGPSTGETDIRFVSAGVLWRF